MKISSQLSVGIDPGINGAIAVTDSTGKLTEFYSFADRVQSVGINELRVVDPQWLHGVLVELRKKASRLTIETPKIATYESNGKAHVGIKAICQLHQQVGSVWNTAVLAGFTPQPADPQNWQGYHSLSKQNTRTVKTVVKDAFLEWHRAHDSCGAVWQSVTATQLSGVADAWAIAHYEYQQPIVKDRKSRVQKVKTAEISPEFVMF